MRTQLVLVTGLDREATSTVAARLLREDAGTVVVQHDLRDLAEGVVRRRLRFRSLDHTAVLELAHGCVSCTLREDVLPLLRKLIAHPDVERVVLALDPGMEPESVCWTLHNVMVGDVTITELAAIDAVLAVVDVATWLTAATGDEALAVVPDDDRSLAQVAVGQAELADAILTTGEADAWTVARTWAVLDRLSPLAPRARISTVDIAELMTAIPPNARRGAIFDVHDPLLRGEPPLDPDCGVMVTVFTDRRPFHPGRLHRTMDVLLDGVVRTRGRMWIASQPDMALWLESAGGSLRVGHAGAWLATAGRSAWDRVSPERRVRASFDWHPRYGDRGQELVILSHNVSPGHLTAMLREALLTPAELAAGEQSWRTFPDPFANPRGEVPSVHNES